MRATFGALTAALLLLASTLRASCEDSQRPNTLQINVSSKGVADVPQPADRAQTIRATLASIKLPLAFHIGLYAIVPNARHIAVAPNGKVVIVGTRMSKVFALTTPVRPVTANAAQPADMVASVAAPQSDPPGPVVKEFAVTIAKVMPNGPCFAPDGTLYLVEQNRVVSYSGADHYFSGEDVRVGTVVAKGELISKKRQSFVHSARVCRIGPDGKLYIALGEPFNVPPPDDLADLDRQGIGGIIRMRRDGEGREVFAHGIRNSVGMDFNPADKTLWFTDNQVDGMGDQQPPGELNRATAAGQNFGFPWYGSGHTRTLEYKAQTPPADAVFPMVEETAHAADLGMVFYRGTAFPQKFRGGIFSAQHGSWNRTVPVGARLMFTPLKKDGTADHSEVFATGWLSPAGKYLGRPVDVAELPDGSLLVSDDEIGALYRIWYDAT